MITPNLKLKVKDSFESFFKITFRLKTLISPLGKIA